MITWAIHNPPRSVAALSNSPRIFYCRRAHRGEGRTRIEESLSSLDSWSQLEATASYLSRIQPSQDPTRGAENVYVTADTHVSTSDDPAWDIYKARAALGGYKQHFQR